jgi:hypothetical protein
MGRSGCIAMAVMMASLLIAFPQRATRFANDALCRGCNEKPLHLDTVIA